MKSLFGLAAAALVAGALWSQQPKAQDEEPLSTIQVDVDVVSLLCSVRDKRGGLIGNLTAEDFEVFEEGKRQDIKYFTRETDLPLTIGLLVDVSGSQASLIEEERRAADQFFREVLRKKDMAFLISFGADSELLQDLTQSTALLREGLDKLRLNTPVGGLHPGPVPTANSMRGTVLYEAVMLAAEERLRSEAGRKAIIVITDGVDVGSRVKLERAIEAAQKADAIIYAIYYVDPRAYHGAGYGYSDSAIKKMAEQTGGRVLRVSRKNTLSDLFREIQDEMRSQYSVAYTPSEPGQSGEFRKLDVRAKDKKLKVHARQGYYVASR
ncbi:MAG: VWA domain-containing protein [Bryobacterales bacterium]|nr:VWA domain-containing protein [Bryobacterales bacterium]